MLQVFFFYDIMGRLYPPLAQLDRVPDSDSGGCRFEPYKAGQNILKQFLFLRINPPTSYFPFKA